MIIDRTGLAYFREDFVPLDSREVLFDRNTEKVFGLAKLAKWYERVRQSDFKAFNTIAWSIQNHYPTFLNYFDNRSTNASVESFNAKNKAFRSQFRGVKCVIFSYLD